MSSKIVHEEELETRLRDALTKFPLYVPSHSVWVLNDQENHYIGYRSLRDRRMCQNQTGIDLQVTCDTCFILSFYIDSDKRRQGNGTILLNILEEFSKREFDTKRFQVTPSGISKEEFFYEHRGYEKLNDVELVKFVR